MLSCENGSTEADVNCRFGKTSTVFQKIRPIWPTQTITMRTKIKLFNTVVIPIAIYSNDIWKIAVKTAIKLNIFQQRCLRKILDITYCDHITSEEILQPSGMKRLKDVVPEHRLRLAGHILRLPDHRHPKIAMTRAPLKGKRQQGRPIKARRRAFQEDLKLINIKWENVDTAANDRQRWRKPIAQCPRQHRRSHILNIEFEINSFSD